VTLLGRSNYSLSIDRVWTRVLDAAADRVALGTMLNKAKASRITS
jgi:hypothetical protein